MKLMKGLILSGVFASFTAFASTAETNLGNLIADSIGQQEDQLSICYLFNGDTVVEKAPCIYESTYVSGGVLGSYTFNKHVFEIQDMADHPSLVNNKEAIYYQRDPRSLKKIKQASRENYLGCYKVKSKKIDFCVK